MIINSKRFIEILARKWQRMAAMRRRRISYLEKDAGLDPVVAEKGHCIVYTTDNIRFEFPLEYLCKNVFIELMRMSEEEFGHPTDGAIKLPCDSTLLEYAISLVLLGIPEDLEKVLLTSIASCHLSASPSPSLGQSHQHIYTLLCGF